MKVTLMILLIIDEFNFDNFFDFKYYFFIIFNFIVYIY